MSASGWLHFRTLEGHCRAGGEMLAPSCVLSQTPRLCAPLGGAASLAFSRPTAAPSHSSSQIRFEISEHFLPCPTEQGPLLRDWGPGFTGPSSKLSYHHWKSVLSQRSEFQLHRVPLSFNTSSFFPLFSGCWGRAASCSTAPIIPQKSLPIPSVTSLIAIYPVNISSIKIFCVQITDVVSVSCLDPDGYSTCVYKNMLNPWARRTLPETLVYEN